MEKVNWQKCAAVIFCIAAATAGLWIAVRYLLGILLPFIIAWAVAMAVTPASGWISKKTKTSEKFWSVVLLFLVLGIIITIITIIVNRLVFEVGRLVEWFTQGGGAGRVGEWISSIIDIFGGLSERLPLVGELEGAEQLEIFLDGIGDMAVKFVNDVITRLGGTLSSSVFAAVSRLPSALLMLSVTVLACFYFCFDIKALNGAMLSILPRRAAEKLAGVRGRVFVAAGRWLRAYLILYGITAFELFIGFIILGVEYPLLLALLGALVDFLPVFGTGTILIPWGLCALAAHDFKLGFGLLILYAASVVVRQIAEPHIIGKSLGVHPLLTLIALYAGFRLFGVVGMVLLPALVTMAVSILMAEAKTKD